MIPWVHLAAVRWVSCWQTAAMDFIAKVNCSPRVAISHPLPWDITLLTHLPLCLSLPSLGSAQALFLF